MELSSSKEQILKKGGTLSIVSQNPSSIQFLINERQIYFNKSYLVYFSKNFIRKKSNSFSLQMSENPWTPEKEFQQATSKSIAYFG